MPLFVTVNSQEVQVGGDLAHIVRNDNGNIGTPGTGGTRDQVTYTETIHDTVDDRMNALCNGFPNITIVVTGVTNTFIITGTGDPNVDGHPITDFSGLCSRPSSVNGAGTGANPGSTINITYDVTGCGGSGYCVYDTGGNSIADPTDVVLFHELAHAFHWANNDFDTANPEPQAENDENLLRTAEGIPLRDPNSHYGGCGTCPHIKTGCFIVSAAFGSPHSPQVDEFRGLRDRLLRQSTLGDEFFNCLFNEYFEFSPDVAQDMDASLPLRTAVAALVVEPLMSFLNLLERYLRGAWQDSAFTEEIARSLDNSCARLHEIDGGNWGVGVISKRFTELLREGDDFRAAGEKQIKAEDIAPDDGPQVLDYLAHAIGESGNSRVYVSWALVTPLFLYWRALADCRIDGRARASRALLEGIEDWLDDLPIPSQLPYSAPEVAYQDLALLKETFFAMPAFRHRFGRRLLAELGSSLPYDFSHVLRSCDYLPPSAEKKGAEHGQV